MSPLREIVDGIHSQVAKIEDDLKARLLSLIFDFTVVDPSRKRIRLLGKEGAINV